MQTPEPWTLVYSSRSQNWRLKGPRRRTGHRRCVAVIGQLLERFSSDVRAEAEANAHLLHAAPALHRILKAAVEAHGPLGDDTRPSWWQAAVNAIAKAEGGNLAVEPANG